MAYKFENQSTYTNKELNNCNITAQVPGEQGTTGVFTRQSTTVSARVRYQEASSSGAAISTGADVARDKRSVQLELEYRLEAQTGAARRQTVWNRRTDLPLNRSTDE